MLDVVGLVIYDIRVDLEPLKGFEEMWFGSDLKKTDYDQVAMVMRFGSWQSSSLLTIDQLY